MVDIAKKNIIIRADGNAQIGVGHLMRCLTIAEASEHKDCVGFVCADEESAKLVQERGFDAYVLGTDYREPESELHLWEGLFTNGRQQTGAKPEQSETENAKRVLLVDSYYVSNAYLESLKRYGYVFLLDDMCKQAWSVDALINYNAFATKEMYTALKSPYKPRYYLGSKYIPIRKEFCNREYQIKNKVKHILITTGGGDVDNIAGQILEYIWSEDYTFHVVTGRFNPHYEKLHEKSQLHGNIHVYHDVKDMAELMMRCDLAVTAGGTTVYELSAIGIPFVCFSYAENQEKLTEYIESNGLAGFGGAYHKDDVHTLKDISRQIYTLQMDTELRGKYSLQERKLVDGEGAFRIAELLWEALK